MAARRVPGLDRVLTRRRTTAAPLRALDERHEAKVPVQLPGAVEEGRASIVCHEVNFQLLTGACGHDVFENSRGRFAGDSHDLQPMALQMQRQVLVAAV